MFRTGYFLHMKTDWKLREIECAKSLCRKLYMERAAPSKGVEVTKSDPHTGFVHSREPQEGCLVTERESNKRRCNLGREDYGKSAKLITRSPLWVVLGLCFHYKLGWVI